jgi:hypothetical protein
MKLTPFILFLILLFVLVISIVFSRFFPIWESKKEGMTEGMIDYNNGNTAGAYTTITPYSSSKQVTKLFDNIYFDTGNSYLLVVDGKMTGNTQPNVRPIENIKVYTPNGDTSSPTSILGTNTVNSDISKETYPSSSSWWTFSTNNTYNTNNNYQIFYFAWDKARFVYVTEKTTEGATKVKLNIKTAYYYNMNGSSYTIDEYPSSKQPGYMTISNISANSNDNTYQSIEDYDANNKVYQINSKLFFDTKNGNLITKNAGLKVYKRNGQQSVSTPYDKPTKIPTTALFTSWIILNEDSVGNYVLYMAIGSKTLIAVIKIDSALKISIDKVVSFNENGLDTRAGWTDNTVNDSSGNNGNNGNNDYTSEYAKWVAYWNAVVKSGSQYSDDYILKTQVVPPVCPTCPNCPNSGTCTNCGGRGGSGTLGGDGTTISGGSGTGGGEGGLPSNLTLSGHGGYATSANPDTLGGATTIQTMEFIKGTENLAKTAAGSLGNVVNTAGDIVKGAGTGTADVLKSAGSGASNLLSSGASGVSGFIKDAASGIAGFTKDAVGGAVGLAKDTVGGAIDLAKDAGSVFSRNDGSGGQTQSSAYGVYNPQTGQTTSSPPQYGQQQGSLGNTKSAIDPYSYNGALVSKPSNFIPVTADFSAFGR